MKFDVRSQRGLELLRISDDYHGLRRVFEQATRDSLNIRGRYATDVASILRRQFVGFGTKPDVRDKIGLSSAPVRSRQEFRASAF